MSSSERQSSQAFIEQWPKGAQQGVYVPPLLTTLPLAVCKACVQCASLQLTIDTVLLHSDSAVHCYTYNVVSFSFLLAQTLMVGACLLVGTNNVWVGTFRKLFSVSVHSLLFLQYNP